MTTPQEPEDEPAGEDSAAASEEGPDEGPAEGSGSISAEDALWRAIVENYGERPEVGPEPEEPVIQVPPSLRDLDPPRRPDEDGREAAFAPDPEDHFVPPEPPPLPIPPPARLLAWLGLFGVPAFVLVALVAHLTLPGWMGLLLMCWFVGGFVFLVASMNPGPGGDHDDGARL